VIDEQSAHEGLDGSVNVIDGDALFDDFVAIDLDELLRHTWQEGGVQSADLRPPACRGNKLVQVIRQELHLTPRPVLEDEGESARGADSGNSGWGKTESHGRRNCAECRVQPGFNLLKLLFSRLSVAPFLH